MRTLLYERWTQDAAQAAAEELGGRHRVARSTRSRMSGDEIVVTVIGPGLGAAALGKLKDGIREDVPDCVPVQVIEEAGRTTPL